MGESRCLVCRILCHSDVEDLVTSSELTRAGVIVFRGKGEGKKGERERGQAEDQFEVFLPSLEVRLPSSASVLPAPQSK